ncbi:MAG: lysophospholipase [Flavobacteriaceae bacterium]|nr:lysophospholipase [Flavobacteriaceae bacterium]|tara:strand:+ start:53862 stop:54551 length:690 start_codon:yes stop_codon:yes gene_type:complete
MLFLNNFFFKIYLFTITFLSFAPSNFKGVPLQNKEIKYLALGDSYTIGEGLNKNNRWPIQLSNMLKDYLKIDVKTKIIAKTGFTTSELIDSIGKLNLSSDFDYVSLLIGVNNQYQRSTITDFEKEFSFLLIKAISFAKKSENVFVLSIPDWGITPFGLKSGRNNIGIEINNYNDIIKKICLKKGIFFIDITEISRKAIYNQDLLSKDSLHPSKKMYKMWADKAYKHLIN